jgi:hypothetical protein
MDTDPMAVEDGMAGRELGNEAESIGVFHHGIPFYHKGKEDISCQD